MPSPADRSRSRRWLERALHIAALALTVFAFSRLVLPRAGGVMRIDDAELERVLPSLVASRVTALHVRFSESPAPATRDVLGAIARAGTRVSWSGPGLAPLAMTADRVREPAAPVRVVVASSGDVEVRDAREVLDTVRAGAGATLEVQSPSGVISASAQRTHASTTAGAPSALKPVLVLGRASWESKFTVAALEEAGWTVEARLSVAPAADVTQGKLGDVDPGNYSVVVALDSTLGSAGRALAGFVRSGGGLVVLAEAATAPSVRTLVPARMGALVPPPFHDFMAEDPWRALPLRPLESMRPDAVRLAGRGTLTTVAARREGAGRVVQVGYEDIWRWRMQGPDEAGAAYRAWWSRLIAGVAPTPATRTAQSSSAEGAPLARLVEALGPATAVPAGSTPSGVLPAWILPLILLIVLAEWTSRRLRGAR
jgi:hypothetical protein